jgi:hypothetical protein
LRTKYGYQLFWLKILKFFDADPDPGSGILSTLDPGFGIKKSRIRDPGTTMVTGHNFQERRLLYSTGHSIRYIKRQLLPVQALGYGTEDIWLIIQLVVQKTWLSCSTDSLLYRKSFNTGFT